MLAKVSNKDSHSVIQELIKQSRRLPKELYRSLTWDRGTEMAGHRTFTLATDIDVLLCEPHSPWQRGTNENTNRLLRQYFPIGADLSIHSQAKLSAVARQLNERPRKRWDTKPQQNVLTHVLRRPVESKPLLGHSPIVMA